MDVSYATIPICEGTFFTLHHEPSRRYHVEEPNESMNDFICVVNDGPRNFSKFLFLLLKIFLFSRGTLGEANLEVTC